MKLFAKKSLGQHFLTSKHVLEQIIDAAHIQKGETILEIGPGTGILTERLLASDAKVIAVEKDDRAFALLQERYAREIEGGKLRLIHGDILDLKTEPFATGPYSIAANIPYYITGSILEKFLEHEPRPSRMVLLVQKEVAERIVARNENGNDEPGKESILSISVKAFGTPKIIANVPKGAFAPPPTVDSAIISIENISDFRFREKNIDINAFFNVVKAGFAHKRKLLIRNLESVATPDDLRHIWTDFRLSEKIRAEDLSLDEWFKIAAKCSLHEI